MKNYESTLGLEVVFSSERCGNPAFIQVERWNGRLKGAGYCLEGTIWIYSIFNFCFWWLHQTNLLQKKRNNWGMPHWDLCIKETAWWILRLTTRGASLNLNTFCRMYMAAFCLLPGYRSHQAVTVRATEHHMNTVTFKLTRCIKQRLTF